MGFLVSGSIPAVCRQRYTKFVPGRRTSRDPHLGLNANGQDRVALPAQPETQPVAGHHRHHGPCAGLSGHRWGHGVMLPLGRSSGGTSNENRPPRGGGIGRAMRFATSLRRCRKQILKIPDAQGASKILHHAWIVPVDGHHLDTASWRK